MKTTNGDGEIRFWHFADLHLGEHEGCGEGPCHACIAERLFAALARELRTTPRPPHIILLAGDLFNLPKEATSGKRTWKEPRR
jgi:3',5'-cyclic AMP phosphodiesterase CpdA